MHASTEAPSAVFGVRYTLASMRKHSKRGLSKSPVETLVTCPCYLHSWTKFHPVRKSVALLRVGRTTPVNATRDDHAVVPPSKNVKPWKPTSTGAITRNDAVNAQRYLGLTLWRRWSRYHRRSCVETKMHCIKLFGQSLMVRDFERQVAEIKIRIAVLNRYTVLGIPIIEPVG